MGTEHCNSQQITSFSAALQISKYVFSVFSACHLSAEDRNDFRSSVAACELLL